MGARIVDKIDHRYVEAGCGQIEANSASDAASAAGDDRKPLAVAIAIRLLRCVERVSGGIDKHHDAFLSSVSPSREATTAPPLSSLWISLSAYPNS